MQEPAPLYCELCDLPLDQCVHGASRQATARVADRLEVSPQHMAHSPGCPHKDDDDFSGWGYITIDTASAWTSIGNGHPVATDKGDRIGMLAIARCSNCDLHGPWH
jgi:hypothetical protein